MTSWPAGQASWVDRWIRWGIQYHDF